MVSVQIHEVISSDDTNSDCWFTHELSSIIEILSETHITTELLACSSPDSFQVGFFLVL